MPSRTSGFRKHSIDMATTFQVGLTRDFLTESGELVYKDIGLSILGENPSIEHRFLDVNSPTIAADQLAGLDAVISLTPKYTADSLANCDLLLAIARFGVGYDMVDVGACTDAGVLLCTTPGAVNYPVAEAVLTWMLALSHRLLIKDRLVRDGKWNERGRFMGSELRERTVGVIGLGGIGGRLIRMLAPFAMNQPLAFDPMVPAGRAAELGVQMVELDELLRRADFVVVCCPLTEQTRGLIGAPQLALMKPTAYLIDAARGFIVDEASLVDALQSGAIAGAAMDVFEQEPVSPDNPLCKLDNVILAPHAVAWTDELFRDIGRMAAGACVALSYGKTPVGIVNPEALQSETFQRKFARHAP